MNPIYIVWELVDDLIGDLERIRRSVSRSPVPYLGFGFGAVIVIWLLLGHSDGGDFLSVAFWSENPEGMRNLLWSLATVAAGAAGLYGLSLAARRTKALDEQARIAAENRLISEQVQFTDRFSKAVEQLGNPNESVRIGAIYSLNRLAEDSSRDASTIIGVLAGHIKRSGQASFTSDAANQQGTPDSATALAVLGRLVPKNSGYRQSGHAEQLDLSGADFRRLSISNCNLDGFILSGSKFMEAKLNLVSAVGADLSAVNAEGCLLSGVDLTDAVMKHFIADRAVLETVLFERANLEYSKFSDVVFQNVIFDGANLLNSNFSKAYIRSATFNGAELSWTTFKDAVFVRTEMHRTIVTGVNFGKSYLAEPTLQTVRYADEAGGRRPEASYELVLPPPDNTLEVPIPF